MNKLISIFLVIIMLCSFAACAKGETWQEKYELGQRYISEGNYEEAILAFTAAIEIDPRNADAYLALAEAYIAIGDEASAIAALEQGLANVTDERLQALLNELAYLGAAEAAAIGSLELTDLSYRYTEGGDIAENNDGAAGGLYIDAKVSGPANVCDVYIATWYDAMPVQNDVDNDIAMMVDIWKQEGSGSIEQSLPFEFGVGRPVDWDELGTTQYVLLVGLDANGDYAAYSLVTVDIPTEDGEDYGGESFYDGPEFEMQKNVSLPPVDGLNVLGLSFIGLDIADFKNAVSASGMRLSTNEDWDNGDDYIWVQGETVSFGSAVSAMQYNDDDYVRYIAYTHPLELESESIDVGFCGIQTLDSMETVLRKLGVEETLATAEELDTLFAVYTWDEAIAEMENNRYHYYDTSIGASLDFGGSMSGTADENGEVWVTSWGFNIGYNLSDNINVSLSFQFENSLLTEVGIFMSEY